MKRWLLKWILKKEYAEALDLIKKARECIVEKYVSYQTFDIASGSFLFTMSEVSQMPEIKFWLLERQRKSDLEIKYESEKNRDFNIGRSMLIDELMGDLKKFRAAYLELLEREKKVKANAQILPQ